MLESFIISLALEILVSLFQQFSNWLHDLEEVWNEPSIIASQPKEISSLGHRCWRLPFQELHHVVRVHRDSLRHTASLIQNSHLLNLAYSWCSRSC
jgi:hypothetical protein